MSTSSSGWWRAAGLCTLPAGAGRSSMMSTSWSPPPGLSSTTQRRRMRCMRMPRSEWNSHIPSMKTLPSPCRQESVGRRGSSYRCFISKQTGLNHEYYAQVSENYLNQHVQPMGPSVFGPPGQVFLYEWSKLRYGVFEEHGYPGDPLYPMFYSKQIFTADGPMSVYRANLCTNTSPSGVILQFSTI